MKYFRIKNWDKYQHRDTSRFHGPMKWIKLHTTILNDDKMFGLSTHDRLTWVLLLLLAGRTLNRLARDSAWIKHELHLKWEPNLALFEELGFIEDCVASTVPAQVQHRLDKKRLDLIGSGVDMTSDISFDEKKRRAMELVKKITEKERVVDPGLP